MKLFPPLPPRDSRPRIVLDLRMVRGRLHGIARYALELTRRLPSLAPDLAFVGLTGPGGLEGDLGPLTPQVPLVECPAEFLSLAEQPALAATLVRLSPALFHATSFSLPALWPGHLVGTLHDANHLVLRENYGRSQLAYYQLIVRPRSQRADALITVSEFSRQELSRELNLSPYQLQVIHNGVDPRFRPITSAERTAFQRKYALPLKYFAVVGNEKAHKNLALIGRIAGELPAPVVLLADKVKPAELGFPPATVALPPLDESELNAFYGAATALLFPSRYEGFGLPALEAMASGTPVIAATGSSLEEIVGSSGRLLGPDDASAWFDAARQLDRDGAERNRLSELGLERAARFSWDVCAQQTLAVYRRVLGG